MQAVVAGIGVGLEVARAVVLEEPLRPVAAPVGRVVIDDERVVAVAEVRPEPAWYWTVTGVSSVPITFDASTRLVIALTIGSSSPAQAAIQSYIVERANSTPSRRKIPSWR